VIPALSIALFIAVCVSQYVRGRLWRYDHYGQAGFIESCEEFYRHPYCDCM
jgi:hypothetical protein